MNTYQWRDSELSNCSYYYKESDGRIVGQANQIVHTKIWLGKVINVDNQEKLLGHYISELYSKKAIENFWLIEDRTLLTAEVLGTRFDNKSG
jgi:hypothetical protein